MQRNDWANQTPLNIPYFIFSVHSLQLTLNWPNKQFNCMLTTDSCTFICWNQTGLIYAWPIALSRFILFSREKSKTKESEIGELYFGLLQSIFVVSKFGICLTWPVAHDKAKCLSCLDDDTLSRLHEGGNFQTGDRLCYNLNLGQNKVDWRANFPSFRNQGWSRTKVKTPHFSIIDLGEEGLIFFIYRSVPKIWYAPPNII